MDGITEVAKVFVEPAIKLVDTVARGCGIIYEPTRRKRLAAASAFEISTIADAIRENIDLPITYNNNGIQIDSSDVKELAERATKRMLLQEMRKQQNIEAIVDNAYEELQKETEVTSDPVDDDWIIRFFNSVEDVSNEKLRMIWGRILAGEIRTPHSFSMRALEILRNISKDEAILFERLANTSFRQNKQSFIPYDMTLLEEYGINFNTLFQLSSAGIISHTPLELGLPVRKELASVMNDYIIGIFSAIDNDKEIEIKIQIFKYTDAGRQILSILSTSEKESSEFAIKYFALLKRKYSTCNVSAYRIKRCEEDYIYHESTCLV